MDEPSGGRPDLARAIAPANDHPASSEAVGEIMDALSELPAPRRELLTNILVSEYHSGPLPSPRALAGYEVVSPGLAREIVDMAVRQQTHDHALQNKVLESETGYRKLTLGAAVTVILGLSTGAVILGIHGQTGAAVAMGTASGLTLVAGAFLKGRDLLLSGEQPAQQQVPAQSPRRSGKVRQRRKT